MRRTIVLFKQHASGAANVPIVNVGPLVAFSDASNHERVQESARELVEAAGSIGTFYISHTGVPQTIAHQAREYTRTFFQLPEEVKEKISVAKSTSMRGYQKLGVNVTSGKRDGHEGVDFFSEQLPDETNSLYEFHQKSVKNNSVRIFGPNQWPSDEDVPNFQHFFEHEYIPRMQLVGEAIVRGFAIGLGLDPDHFRQHYNNPFWSMRLLNYPSSPERLGKVLTGDDGLGCGEHTDYGCLTILNTDPLVKGCLQSRGVNGEWLAVDPIVQDDKEADEIFAVNIADMMERWTNGRFRATPHLVLPPGPEYNDRVSIPFFLDPNIDALIQPLVMEGEASQFEPVVYGEHLYTKMTSNFDMSVANENFEDSPSKNLKL